MNKKALELSLAVYRVTKLFPEGEVLVGLMRQVANLVLANLISGQTKQVREQIEILLSYFQIASRQNWTKQVNFVILAKEYQALLNELEQVRLAEPSQNKGVPKIEQFKELSQRQNKIIEYIKQKGSVKLKDISVLFPMLSLRTVRKELNKMAQQEILSQQGVGRGSFYKINKALKGH